MMIDAIYTDPSEELAGVAKWLQGIVDNSYAHHAFSEAMSLASGSAAFYDALSAITTRAANFVDLVQRLGVSSPKMTPLFQGELTAAANNILSSMSPSALGKEWSGGNRETARRAQTWFEAGSPLIGTFVRLKIFPETRRLELLEELQAAYRALIDSIGPQEWQDIALAHGLGRLILMIQAFPFFGYAAVEQQSIAVGFATHSAALRAQSDGKERLKILHTIAVTVAVVIAAVTAVNTADDTMSTAGHFLQWAQGGDPYEFGGQQKAITRQTK